MKPFAAYVKFCDFSYSYNLRQGHFFQTQLLPADVQGTDLTAVNWEA
ncbi:MAG: hypothetical protein NZ482_09630 [Gloeomargarita sp. SKYG98]|nr:hypothetical protein [Gloeomargarita sp. SKYG98]